MHWLRRIWPPKVTLQGQWTNMGILLMFVAQPETIIERDNNNNNHKIIIHQLAIEHEVPGLTVECPYTPPHPPQPSTFITDTFSPESHS